MRMALAQAVHHARRRAVFGKALVEQPMMRAVLAEMALDVEAATALVMRLCRSFDLAASDAREAACARLLTPAVKYWVCKSAPALVYEAMECLGGNGYVEDSLLPRLYREAPVNAIWEGSGNVMCLDVLRALTREPESGQAVLEHLAGETRALPHAQDAVAFVRGALSNADAEAHARTIVERLAVLAAVAALRASAPASVVEAFAQARLGARLAVSFGTAGLSAGQTAEFLDRACG
jgi:putative acyl-CoA dehydrogenase